MSDWQRTAQEGFWFPLIVLAEKMRREERLNQEQVAERIGQAASSLRYWRGRYWTAFEEAYAPGGNLQRFRALSGAGDAPPEEQAPDNEARRM